MQLATCMHANCTLHTLTIVLSELLINMKCTYYDQGWATEDHNIVLLDDELDENGKPSDQQ